MIQYSLQKYTPTSKIDCPHCGGRKTFTCYEFTDTDSGEVGIMSTDFGYCDRENNCGFNNSPHATGNSKSQPYTPPPEVPQKWIMKEEVYTSLRYYHLNEFTIALTETFGQELAMQAIEKYFIGTSKDFLTLYYYIDTEGKITSAKTMKYIGLNRDKDSMPFYPHKVSDGYKACLFGLHLVHPDKDIHLVEAEKTAVIMSMFHNEPYLATGGAKGLTTAKIKDLKDIGFNGNIYIYPDADKAGREAAQKWKTDLEDPWGFNVEIVDREERNNGEDLADLILEAYGK